MSPGAPSHVLVVEPTELFADVVSTALQDAGREVVRFDAPPAELLDEAVRVGPAVVVIGPTFGRAGLPAVVPGLLAHGIRTVLVSPHALDRVEAQIMMAGASGYLSAATSDIAEVAAEVDRVVNGSSALHPDVVREMLLQWRQSRLAAAAPEAAVELTAREIDVVRGLRDGLTTRLIAARLGVSEKTVEAHKSRLFAKVGAKNSSQALQLVSAQGLA